MSLANNIPVKFFRTTLFWPLAFDFKPDASEQAPDGGASKESPRAWWEGQKERLELTGVWVGVDDTLEHIPAPAGTSPEQQLEAARYNARAYAEYTYFHDYVQQFLFNQAHSDTAPFLLFRRSDITGARVTIAHRGTFDFNVLRINLYLLKVGVAMIAVELEWRASTEKPALSLADAMSLNDQLRRAHAPYMDRGRENLGPDRVPGGYVPRRFIWLEGDGQESRELHVGEPDQDVGGLAATLRRSKPRQRGIPPFSHLAWLLNGPAEAALQDWRVAGNAENLPSKGWVIAPARGDVRAWRHVCDDRLPALFTIELARLSDYRTLPAGDWMRLCFLDGPGADAYPFARRFLERDWDEHVYDRFHYQPDEVLDDSSDAPSRYLICDYAFGAVGVGASEQDSFFKTHIAEHVRRHYFQLMLLCQLERTTLLSISSRITRAVAAYEKENSLTDGGKAEEHLENRLEQIEHDLLQYAHRFRFTEVSGQLQAREIYRQLREHIGLSELYREIRDELDTATGFLATRNQKRATRAQEAQTKAQDRLAMIASLAVPPGLAFALLGMNVFAGSDVLDQMGLKKEDTALHLSVVFGTLTAAFGLSLLAMLFLGRRQAQESDPDRIAKSSVAGLCCLCLVIGGLLLFRHLDRPPPVASDPAQTGSQSEAKSSAPSKPVPEQAQKK